MSSEGLRLGPYRLDRLIGKGGMGEVYRAHDSRLGRDVAVKLLPDEFTRDPNRLTRFEREARALASLNHPCIATVYGFEEDGERRGLILELLDGETLAARVRRGALPIAEATRIGEQIASALEAAHEKGIIHRDLKPANVQITSQGVVKVLDFGLAKLTPAPDGTTETVSATREGVVLGTAPYMSPEQARGLQTDKRTDVWAFGCSLYEMLTGTQAFAGVSPPDVLAAIASRDPDLTLLPVEAPIEVRRLVEQCLQKDPAQRLRDMGDARIALQSGRQPPVVVERHRAVLTRRLALVLPMTALVAMAVTWLVARPTTRIEPAARISLTIDPPEGVVWGDLPPDPLPAVSPDGRKVAFVGRSQSGAGIWVRDLADSQAQLIMGSSDVPENSTTGTSIGLFWSSDSRRVGYCVDGKLKIAGLDGRPSEPIDAGCISGTASWSSTGEILFSRADGLHRISDQGGVATRVTMRDARQTGPHLSPRWLPDGRRFIYAAIEGDPAATGIYAGSIDGSPPVRIVSDESKADYVASSDGSGYLIFVRGVTLIAQPLDSDLRPTGASRVLALRMANGPGGLPSFSASASLLVHRSGASNRASAWVFVDRQGRPLGSRIGGQTAMGAAALSPDETKLAYARRHPDTLTLELWMVDFASRTDERLTDRLTVVDAPAFSRDGKHLAFHSAEGGRLQLFVKELPTGATTRVVASLTTGVAMPDWSADGKMLIASAGRSRIVAIPLATPNEPRTVVENGVQPRLSPDGRWLAYTSTVSGASEVYVQRFPDGSERTRVSLDGGFQPPWRGDGKELYFLTSEGALMAVPLRSGATFGQGQPLQLFKERFRDDGASYLRRDFLPSREGARFLVNVQTGARVPLTAIRNWLTPATPD